MTPSSGNDPPWLDRSVEPGRSIGAVVALKTAQHAKSRLAPVADPLRRRIAWSMAVDTLTALAAVVDIVLVVSDQPSIDARLRRLGVPVTVVPESGQTGMNAALAVGERALVGLGCQSVLACVGDLPALRPDSLRLILSASRSASRSFVADASGIGTTMLIAHGVPLSPRFQGRSAAAHKASGAIPLDGPVLGEVSDARRDVDTEVDLADAYRLGLGATTAALFDPDTGMLGGYTVITVLAEPRPADGQRAITSTGHRILLPSSAIVDSLRAVHGGQRLHAVVSRDRVLAAWL